MGGFTFGTF